jgi:LmbE family N-acetylglucosaminyl deacetylase
MTGAMTRQTFLLALPGALLARPLAAETARPKLLIVAAHPDDEYAFAATTYRLARELGWTADHVVITNGEAGYRYAALAETVYGVGLTGESQGRSRLPAIRKRETLAAGKVLGIRRHYFLGQRDSGFGADAASAPTGNWDRAAVLSFLGGLLRRERYDAIFTLLPTPETHGHHRAATLLALEAAASLPEDRRPLLLAADPCAGAASTELFGGLPGQPLTRTRGERPAFVFDRDASFGYRNALNYQIVVNWFIAEHKSQGLFQTDSGKHQLEQFWLFEASGRDADSRARALAASLTPAAHQAAALERAARS